MAAVPSIGRASRVEPGAAPGAEATSELYERYSHQVFGYCLHHLGSREEAEDAVQTTFMNAFRGLGRGIVPECEQAWLFKIAHNVCLSRRRSSWRRGRVEAPSNLETLQEVIPAREKIADELIPLQDVLEDMPENQRRAILLREWQGLSYREVAHELGVSQAAVETLIFRARRSLATGLEEAPAVGSLRKRVRRGADVGGVVAFLKTLLGGGGAAAVKVAGAVVLAGAAVATTTADDMRHRSDARRPAVAPATVAHQSPTTAPAIGAVSLSTAKPSALAARGQGDSARLGSPAAGQSQPAPAQTAPPSAAKPPTAATAVDDPAPSASPEERTPTPSSAQPTPSGRAAPASKDPNKADSASSNRAKGKAKGGDASAAPPAPLAPEPADDTHPGRGNGAQPGSPPSPDTTPAPGNSGDGAKGKADADTDANGNGNGPPETPPGQSGDPQGNTPDGK